MVSRRMAFVFLLLIAAVSLAITIAPTSVVQANIDTTADAQCTPVNTKCGCGEVPDQQTGRCRKAQGKEKNMHKCECKSSAKPAGGYCRAEKDCKGTWYTDQNGKKQSIDPNASERDIAQKIGSLPDLSPDQPMQETPGQQIPSTDALKEDLSKASSDVKNYEEALRTAPDETSPLEQQLAEAKAAEADAFRKLDELARGESPQAPSAKEALDKWKDENRLAEERWALYQQKDQNLAAQDPVEKQPYLPKDQHTFGEQGEKESKPTQGCSGIWDCTMTGIREGWCSLSPFAACSPEASPAAKNAPPDPVRIIKGVPSTRYDPYSLAENAGTPNKGKYSNLPIEDPKTGQQTQVAIRTDRLNLLQGAIVDLCNGDICTGPRVVADGGGRNVDLTNRDARAIGCDNCLLTVKVLQEGFRTDPNNPRATYGRFPELFEQAAAWRSENKSTPSGVALGYQNSSPYAFTSDVWDSLTEFQPAPPDWSRVSYGSVVDGPPEVPIFESTIDQQGLQYSPYQEPEILTDPSIQARSNLDTQARDVANDFFGAIEDSAAQAYEFVQNQAYLAEEMIADNRILARIESGWERVRDWAQDQYSAMVNSEGFGFSTSASPEEVAATINQGEGERSQQETAARQDTKVIAYEARLTSQPENQTPSNPEDKSPPNPVTLPQTSGTRGLRPLLSQPEYPRDEGLDVTTPRSTPSESQVRPLNTPDSRQERLEEITSRQAPPTEPRPDPNNIPPEKDWHPPLSPSEPTDPRLAPPESQAEPQSVEPKIEPVIGEGQPYTGIKPPGDDCQTLYCWYKANDKELPPVSQRPDYEGLGCRRGTAACNTQLLSELQADARRNAALAQQGRALLDENGMSTVLRSDVQFNADLMPMEQQASQQNEADPTGVDSTIGVLQSLTKKGIEQLEAAQAAFQDALAGLQETYPLFDPNSDPGGLGEQPFDPRRDPGGLGNLHEAAPRDTDVIPYEKNLLPPSENQAPEVTTERGVPIPDPEVVEREFPRPEEPDWERYIERDLAADAARNTGIQPSDFPYESFRSRADVEEALAKAESPTQEPHTPPNANSETPNTLYAFDPDAPAPAVFREKVAETWNKLTTRVEGVLNNYFGTTLVPESGISDEDLRRAGERGYEIQKEQTQLVERELQQSAFEDAGNPNPTQKEESANAGEVARQAAAKKIATPPVVEQAPKTEPKKISPEVKALQILSKMNPEMNEKLFSVYKREAVLQAQRIAAKHPADFYAQAAPGYIARLSRSDMTPENIGVVRRYLQALMRK